MNAGNRPARSFRFTPRRAAALLLFGFLVQLFDLCGALEHLLLVQAF
jgi:hypothetical protein